MIIINYELFRLTGSQLYWIQYSTPNAPQIKVYTLFVIASEAKQARKTTRNAGLLRCARNDGNEKTLCPLKLYRGDARRASLYRRIKSA